MSSSGPSGAAALDFVRRWSPGGPAHALTERAGAQQFFVELCRVLEVPEPGDPNSYCFERGLMKTGGAAARIDGFADVWMRGHFAWEFKAPGKNLDGALRQLMMYALPLENPPLLVVSDRLRIEVHTHFTGTPSERHTFALDTLTKPEVQQRLRQMWSQPDAFRPKRSNREITEDAARTFAGTAYRLRATGVPAEQTSHFLTQCLFCFFAEDVRLLPERLFERLVGVQITPEAMRDHLGRLFQAMRDGGLFGVDAVPWFNGGLFSKIDVPPLTVEDVAALKAASSLDWSAIDPSIFGTLFERGLDPNKRSQLGAHYTDPATILRLVEPVVQRPLLAEWQAHKAQVEAALSKSKKHGDKAYRDAQAAFVGFLERLKTYRVLDPACGSGNFLYLALKCLKDIEHQVNLEAEALGLQRQHDVTGPHNVLGIELNEFAAELARVTVWIGELQWRVQRGYGFKTNPILEPLDHIECRDAVLNADGSEAAWPKADAVVGNPPFLGGSKKRQELGDEIFGRLSKTFEGRVAPGADLVCYWFDIARRQLQSGRLVRAGLVATNSIRQASNRHVLETIAKGVGIFEAWDDLEWINEGAAVRVSLICFGPSAEPRLNGELVAAIGPDLHATSPTANFAAVQSLPQCRGASFQGSQKIGPFDVPHDTATAWLRVPNPNGKSNALVLRPLYNGIDVTRRCRGVWAIDFGTTLSEVDASLFEDPFKFVVQNVKPERDTNARDAYRKYWWRHGEPRVGMRDALSRLTRFAAISEKSKHFFFVWLSAAILPDKRLIVVARGDDATIGLLSARPHRLWSLRLGSTLEDRPCYTPTTCFETFPFPAGLTPADTAHQRTDALPDGARIPADLPPAVRPHAEAIARAAKRLSDLRDAWLNPPEWTERVPEVVPLGMDRSPYPDRIVARPGFEKQVAQRTLTNLYNARPAWLAQAHETLDAAVAAAYGWTDYTPAMPDDEILRRLLALNRQRSAGAQPPAS
jgi:hypothetical protein